MSRNSENVKNWRKNSKIRMVESMGGCCQICGYNKSLNALEFHHIDPNEKEMGLGGVRGNIVKWEKIASELRKCILLCSNCHREIHDGVTILPDTYSKFDERYLNYKKIIEKEPQIRKGKFRKVNWDDINLPILKENYSNVQIGKMLNVSETAVRKQLKKLTIKSEINNDKTNW